MALTEAGYLPRLLDAQLAEDLRTFGAVAVEGPKWCGKTWACLNQAESVFYLLDPAGGHANRRLAALDPGAALTGAAPHLVDEWQEVPELWDAVRFSVDRSQLRGQFLLTGSTKPKDDGREPRHSGVGRIAVRRMRPMTLFESGDSTGSVSLEHLADGQGVGPARGRLSLDGLIEVACRGGWPGALGLNAGQGRRLASGYLRRLAESDITEAGKAARNPAKTGPFLRSLARHSATLASVATIRKDMAQAFGATATDVTVTAYLGALRRLYVLEEVPPWAPKLRSRTPLRRAPKRLLADPSLMVAGLGAGPAGLKADLDTFGFVFETLVLRDLSAFADALGAELAHYRDDEGLEADAVLVFPDARWAAVEVKLGFDQVDAAAQALLSLARQVRGGGGDPPAFLAVVVGVGALAQTRPDGVHVVPVDLLGP
jgi:predicted AAA+ superfamily ATPase